MESCTEFSQGPLSTLELSRDPPKDKQILTGSVIRHFSASEKNSFFWRQAHFFPTIEVLPKCAFSLGPDDSS